jgi:hypothetical protein
VLWNKVFQKASSLRLKLGFEMSAMTSNLHLIKRRVVVIWRCEINVRYDLKPAPGGWCTNNMEILIRKVQIGAIPVSVAMDNIKLGGST